jgi:cleavage and polyadenylation specificity factor subunit 1
MSGSLALISTLDETTYRRMVTLQDHFQSQATPLCGLNPYDHRNIASEGFAARGTVDGSLVLQGWAEASARGKSEVVSKAGAEEEVLREDLRGLQVPRFHWPLA